MTNYRTEVPGKIDTVYVDLANVNTYSFKPTQTAKYTFRMSYVDTAAVFIVSMFGIDELLDG